MGKFSSRPSPVEPIALAPAAPTADVAEERRKEESDKAGSRLRLAEKRRRGRRASILSDISNEEAQLATTKRPAGRAASVLFGS